MLSKEICFYQRASVFGPKIQEGRGGNCQVGGGGVGGRNHACWTTPLDSALVNKNSLFLLENTRMA